MTDAFTCTVVSPCDHLQRDVLLYPPSSICKARHKACMLQSMCGAQHAQHALDISVAETSRRSQRVGVVEKSPTNDSHLNDGLSACAWRIAVDRPSRTLDGGAWGTQAL